MGLESVSGWLEFESWLCSVILGNLFTLLSGPYLKMGVIVTIIILISRTVCRMKRNSVCGAHRVASGT